MNPNLLIFFAAILVIGIVVLVLVMTRGKGRTTLDVDRFRRAWLGIEQQLQKGNDASYQLCILNADKLLDKALRERGFKGETMGERMKAAGSIWQNANVVWSAHKIRNRIAHETNVALTYEETRRALACFKQGLKDVGAI